MAVTGFVLFLFVIGHLAGNLQIFLGPEAINRYGHFLQSNPELIWPARLILLLVVGLHLWSAVELSRENKAAHPVDYVVYHLLHFTVQVQYLNLTGQDFGSFVDAERRHDIFKMMVVGFSNAWVPAFYLLGMALLCVHLSHGASSMFQSVGWKNQAYGPFLDRLARAVAILIFLGYASIPIAILLGYGKEYLK